MPMYKDCFYIKRVCTVIKGWWNLSLQVNANLQDSVYKCWRRWMSKIEKDKRLFLVEYMERKNEEYFNRKSNDRRRSPTSSKRKYNNFEKRMTDHDGYILFLQSSFESFILVLTSKYARALQRKKTLKL